jgi:glycosyltransferase involved in cell wall biosynthesis
MAIHQLIVSAAPGDAATNAAFEIRDLLRRIGPSELFAANIHEGLLHEVRPLDDLLARDSIVDRRDPIVFHGSIGSDAVFDLLWQFDNPLVLVYHNVSPDEYFREYSEDFADLLREGRRRIGQLRDRVVVALADSEFNATELVLMGFERVLVSPLIIDVHRMRSIQPDPVALSQLQALEGPVLLYVGQFLPHKRPEFLLQAFHILSTYLVPGAHLALIGASRLPAYRHRLDELIRELNLPRLHMVGAVPDPILSAYLNRADIFVTASEHEGFCVPLIEAMAFDIPVVARQFAAIPDTIGDAGICLAPEDGPAVFAEAVTELVAVPELGEVLAKRGRERVKDYDSDLARVTLLHNLLEVL